MDLSQQSHRRRSSPLYDLFEEAIRDPFLELKRDRRADAARAKRQQLLEEAIVQDQCGNRQELPDWFIRGRQYRGRLETTDQSPKKVSAIGVTKPQSSTPSASYEVQAQRIPDRPRGRHTPAVRPSRPKLQPQLPTGFRPERRVASPLNNLSDTRPEAVRSGTPSWAGNWIVASILVTGLFAAGMVVLSVPRRPNADQSSSSPELVSLT